MNLLKRFWGRSGIGEGFLLHFGRGGRAEENSLNVISNIASRNRSIVLAVERKAHGNTRLPDVDTQRSHEPVIGRSADALVRANHWLRNARRRRPRSTCRFMGGAFGRLLVFVSRAEDSALCSFSWRLFFRR